MKPSTEVFVTKPDVLAQLVLLISGPMRGWSTSEEQTYLASMPTVSSGIVVLLRCVKKLLREI